MSHDDMDFETNRELGELAQALRENRPTPEPEFTDRLDRVVDDHFPPEWTDEVSLGRNRKGRLGGVVEDIRRRWRGRRVLLPAMAGLASVMLVAVVVAVGTGQNGGSSDSGGDVNQFMSGSSSSDAGAMSGDSAVLESAAPSAGAVVPGDRLGPEVTEKQAVVPGGSRDRAVALEAEITLGTDPDGVQEVANEIVSVTDEHNGIVMDSSVKDGEEGVAGASFNLLIPSAQVESAVADLSGIADLRSRNQELSDITAPTNRAEDNVTDSKAKIESLLGELEEATSDEERVDLEQQIRFERQELAYYESQLKRLERKADYTPVSVAVETGGDTSSDDASSGWGFSDAIDDAGKMLGVAAGVTVIALAIAIPIGIVILIALAMNRAWVRRSRRKVLADEE